MAREPSDVEPLLLRADALVDSAFSADYRQDPILGKLSRMHGIAKCLTREHGLLLEEAIAVGLRRSGRIEVSRGVRFPITDAARSLVAANPVEMLDRVRLTFDSEARSSYDLDLAAVTTDGRHAWAVDIKRGAGSTGGSRRAQVEREMHAVKLLLRSFFRQQGYAVDDVKVAIIDVYGGGGFTPGLTVTRKGIDAFFGTPVTDVIDALEDRLRRRLEAAWTLVAGSMHGKGQAFSPEGPGREPEPDDTPVASARLPWADAFSVGARRAAPRSRAAGPVPLAGIEAVRREGHRFDA